jgi:hypothetical protein
MRGTIGFRLEDERISQITGRLVAEYGGVLPPGTVLRCIARCRRQLRRAGVQAGLDHAVEDMARHRLRELQEVRGSH